MSIAHPDKCAARIPILFEFGRVVRRPQNLVPASWPFMRGRRAIEAVTEDIAIDQVTAEPKAHFLGAGAGCADKAGRRTARH